MRLEIPRPRETSRYKTLLDFSMTYNVPTQLQRRKRDRTIGALSLNHVDRSIYVSGTFFCPVPTGNDVVLREFIEI